VRDKTKSKTIREKKMDRDMTQKKIEEENLIKHQFRHKPIPTSVSMPRYKQICEKNAQRREDVVRNSVAITK